MFIYPFLNNTRKYIITILFVLGFASLLFAQGISPEASVKRGYITSSDIPETKKDTVIIHEGEIGNVFKKQERNLTELQNQARFYRNQGLELQRMGNVEEAMSFYQKAIQLDSGYAIAYNDLGIIYEALGSFERAEDSYLKCIKIDPEYLSAYSNLALLYENKRDFDQAALYWKKRMESGSPDDPWTQKASQRLKDIRVVKEWSPSRVHEQEVFDLMKDILNQKSLKKDDSKSLAQQYFKQAKRSYEEEDYATAIKQALDAQQLDPANKEIEKFIDQVRTRALSR